MAVRNGQSAWARNFSGDTPRTFGNVQFSKDEIRAMKQGAETVSTTVEGEAKAANPLDTVRVKYGDKNLSLQQIWKIIVEDEGVREYGSMNKGAAERAGIDPAVFDSFHAAHKDLVDKLNRMEVLGKENKITEASVKELQQATDLLIRTYTSVNDTFAAPEDATEEGAVQEDKPEEAPKETVAEAKDNVVQSAVYSLEETSPEKGAGAGKKEAVAKSADFEHLSSAELAEFLTSDEGKEKLNALIKKRMRAKGLTKKELSSLESAREITDFTLADNISKSLQKDVWASTGSDIEDLSKRLHEYADVTGRFSGSVQKLLDERPELKEKRERTPTRAPSKEGEVSDVAEVTLATTESVTAPPDADTTVFERLKNAPGVNPYAKFAGGPQTTERSETGVMEGEAFTAPNTPEEARALLESYKQRVRDARKINPAAMVAAPNREFIRLVKETEAEIGKVQGFGMYGEQFSMDEYPEVTTKLRALDTASKEAAAFLSGAPDITRAATPNAPKTEAAPAAVVPPATEAPETPEAASARIAAELNAVTKDGLNDVTLKNSSFLDASKRARELWRGEKVLKNDLTLEQALEYKKSGELPLQKQGEFISAVEAYYKTGVLRRLGALARSAVGINPSELSPEMKQKREEAVTALKDYSLQSTERFKQRLDRLVTNGEITAEERDSRILRFRAAQARRTTESSIKYLHNAESGGLSELQHTAFGKVMSYYGGLSNKKKAAVGIGLWAGSTALLGAFTLPGTAVRGVLSTLQAFGVTSAVSGKVMKYMTKSAVAAEAGARARARETFDPTKIEEYMTEQREAANKVRRSQVRGVGASVALGMGGGIAGGMAAHGINDAVHFYSGDGATDGGIDTPPTPPPDGGGVDGGDTQPDGAQPISYDELRERLEPYKDHTTVGEVIKDETHPEFGPRPEYVPPHDGDVPPLPPPDDSEVVDGGETKPPTPDDGGGGVVEPTPTLHEHVVVDKDTLWRISEDQFKDKLAALHDESIQDKVLMKLRDLLSENGAKGLHEIGGTSDHADIIRPGEHIDLDKLEKWFDKAVTEVTGGTSAEPMPLSTPLSDGSLPDHQLGSVEANQALSQTSDLEATHQLKQTSGEPFSERIKQWGDPIDYDKIEDLRSTDAKLSDNEFFRNEHIENATKQAALRNAPDDLPPPPSSDLEPPVINADTTPQDGVVVANTTVEPIPAPDRPPVILGPEVSPAPQDNVPDAVPAPQPEVPVVPSASPDTEEVRNSLLSSVVAPDVTGGGALGAVAGAGASSETAPEQRTQEASDVTARRELEAQVQSIEPTPKGFFSRFGAVEHKFFDAAKNMTMQEIMDSYTTPWFKGAKGQKDALQRSLQNRGFSVDGFTKWMSTLSDTANSWRQPDPTETLEHYLLEHAKHRLATGNGNLTNRV